MTDAEQIKLKELLSGEFGKLIQSYSDSKVSQALKTFQEKNPTNAEVMERLARIQDAADERVKKIELDKTILKKCYEKGIDYNAIEKLGIAFENEETIEDKLNVLKDNIKLKSDRDLNELMARSSYKPSSGSGRVNNRFDIPDDQWDKLSMVEKQVIEAGRAK